MKKVGIYIHFPFCVSKCAYCNFNSYSHKNDLQLKYFESLLKEISLYANSGVQIDTIFIGGGTPSIMFDGCISTLLSEIKKKFEVLDDAEITIEANPNSITKTKVQEWKDSGVNRVSVGLQTTNENILRLIGRPHTRADYVRAIGDILGGGITNINTDCLIGLPKQKLSDLKRTLNLVTKLNCTHVSVYSLILEENTPLWNMVESGKVTLPKDEKVLGMYDFAFKFLSECGYHRYEVSNYAKQGCECKHNLNTWQMHEYLGFGAGAHSYFDGRRFSNKPSIEDYINAISKGEKPIEYDEKISSSEMFEETVMLGLRTTYGVDLKKLKDDFGVDLVTQKSSVIDEFLKLNMIEIKGNTLVVTNTGLSVLNKIILELVS